jgi:hypothetical protein
MAIDADLDRFYGLLSTLEKHPAQGHTLGEYSGKSRLPSHGVYFFREPGEYRGQQSGMPRVVRVGTHAVSANSKSTLWKRLRAHRGQKDGRGNHRGSVFRRHVGFALLLRDRARLGELLTWGDRSARGSAVRVTEDAHEQRVSAYLCAMTVLWVEVPDASGRTSQRRHIERNTIALLSNSLKPVDAPGTTWLGLHSPHAVIRQSGLWNVNHVEEPYDPDFLELFAQFVMKTKAR